MTSRRKRTRADGSPAPRGRRTPIPPPDDRALAELDELTDGLPADLRTYRDVGILSARRRYRLEEAIRHRTRSLTAVLHGVHDPHNQAAVLRTAEALGLQEVHYVPTRDVSYNPSERVTQNAHRWIDLVPHADFPTAARALKSRGLTLLATALAPDTPSLAELDLTRPTALVFGSERDGLPGAVVAACDGTFRIPLYGLSQSLNISVAAALALHRAVDARRRAWGEPGDLDPQEKMALRRRFYARAAGERDAPTRD